MRGRFSNHAGRDHQGVSAVDQEHRRGGSRQHGGFRDHRGNCEATRRVKERTGMSSLVEELQRDPLDNRVSVSELP